MIKQFYLLVFIATTCRWHVDVWSVRVIKIFKNKMIQFLQEIYNSWPWKSVTGQKLLAPTKTLEISPEISFTLHYWPDANGKPKNQDATVSHSKLLYQFVVFVEAYPYSKNQHHSSIQSWYIVDVILRITFGRSGYAWPHPYKSTESDRCICVLLSTYKK